MGFAIPKTFFSSFTSGYFFISYSEGAAGTLNGKGYGNAGGSEEFGLISGQGNINTAQLSNVTPVRESATSVPEPSAALLGSLSLLGLLRRRRR